MAEAETGVEPHVESVRDRRSGSVAEAAVEPADRRLVARERELAAVEGFLTSVDSDVASLVVEGPAGIGKTSVWREGLRQAQRYGARVLVAQPTAEDATLDFVCIVDLLEDLTASELGRLPGPQRRALEAALLLVDEEAPIDRRLLYTAVRSVLRVAASDAGRLVVAIDDVQWLDAASDAALAFAARRLGAVNVRFLMARRTPSADRGGQLLAAAVASDRLAMEGLSLGAVGQLVHQRLGVRLPRPLARRVYEVSAGNAMFVLELARELLARGPTADLDKELPLPDRVEAALAGRVDALSPLVRRALLTVALSPDARLVEVSEVAGAGAIDEAVQAAALVCDGPRVRLEHPMLGEVAKGRSRPTERRELHLALAAATADPERRALHLAQAAIGPDAALAGQLAGAAAHAARRSARAMAANLAERSLDLTPPGDPHWWQRLLDAAGYDYVAGSLERATELLEGEVDSLPTPSMRAEANLLLACAGDFLESDTQAYLHRALAEERGPTALRVKILAWTAYDLAVGLIERLAEAEELALEALAIASGRPDFPGEHEASSALAWVRMLRGRRIDDLLPRFSTISDGPSGLFLAPERAQAVDLMWRGEVDRARDVLRSLAAQADERGEAESYYAARVQWCEVEVRAGRWNALEALLEEWDREQVASREADVALMRFRAWLTVGRGDVEEGVRAAQATVAAAESSGGRWHALEAIRARGVAALLGDDLESAYTSLREVWDRVRAGGVGNPGAFPVAADLVDAAARLGRIDEAEALATELTALGERQDHPWAQAASARARGLVAIARHDDATATRELVDAAARFGALGLAFEQGCTLLALGIAHRRLRRRREARACLQEANELFVALGAHGWAQRARMESERIGGRTAAGQQLTGAERRIATLVAEGRSNKEIAALLVVTVSTVEAHLTRIYAKLGVRSRTLLARRLAELDEQS